MTSPRIILCLTLLAAGLTAAPASAAGPVPLLDAPDAADLALAGEKIVVARELALGRIAVDAVSIQDGTVRRMLRVRRDLAVADVTGSAERVAVLVFYASDDDYGIQTRLYTGPPTGPLRRVARRAPWRPFEAAVDGDRVAVAEVETKTFRTRVRLLVPRRPPRILPLRNVVTVALAGDHVAGITRANRLIALNLATGAREIDARVRGVPRSLDVAADGRVVADLGNPPVTAAPGQRLRRLGTPDLSHPVFAGAGIAAIQTTTLDAQRPAVLDAGATEPRPVGVPTYALTDHDADERRMAWIANGCVLYAPLDAAPPTEPPVGPCPRAEAEFTGAEGFLRGRKLRVQVTCVAAPAPGCTGTIVLRLRGIAGRATYSVPAGAQRSVTVRVTRRAAQLLRRRVRRNGQTGLDLYGHLDGGRRPKPGIVIVDVVL